MLTFAPINHCNKCKAHAWRELMTGVIDTGEMAEWSIAAVLKTVEGNTSGGSNPSLSAINIKNQCFTKQTPDFTPKNVKSGVCLLRIWHYYFIPFFLMVETPFMVITL